MMKKRKSYADELQKFVQAIDIAIDAYRSYPPPMWTAEIVDMVTGNLQQDKIRRLEADQKFQNLASLKYDIDTLFIYFQEAQGPTVDYFWKEIKQAGLDYQREDKLSKVLKRGKIRGRIEYDYITDILVAAEQVGDISAEQAEQLRAMLAAYERK
jgi:hypothetical protein